MNDRAKREKDLHNKGIDRVKYSAGFGHANAGYAKDRLYNNIKMIMKHCQGKNVLEIGSASWNKWVDFEEGLPQKLTCINISEKELEKGISLRNEANIKISDHEFLIMDANKLDFEDESFDVVFGDNILHHLDFEKSVREIHRVLKKDGKILFLEPLGRNPVGKIVRKLTPSARTPDEKPLDKEEIKILKNLFHSMNEYYQLFFVPAGYISKYIFKSPYNPLMYIADKMDIFFEFLLKNIGGGIFSVYPCIRREKIGGIVCC